MQKKERDMNCRGAMANLVACTIVAAQMALGCGGGQEEPLHVRHESAPRSMTEPGTSVEVPDATAREMKACVEGMYYQSAEPSHAFQYNLGANEQGKVLEVKLRDSTLRDAPLEACFERALAAMEVPKDVLRIRGEKPVSGGKSTTSSRADVGIVQAAAAPIAFLPIVLVAGGVTILVGVSIYVVAHAVDDVKAEQERCKKVKQGCIDDCSDDTLDDGFHEPMFSRCVRSCMEQANCR
jgi:hypothetical protein